MNYAKTTHALFATAALALAIGTTPASAEDAYIQSNTQTDGAVYSINTGYRIKPTTGIYADFEFLAHTADVFPDNKYQQFVWEATGGGTARFYINGETGNGALAWNFTTEAVWSTSGQTMVPGTRYQMCVDASTRTAWLDVEGTRCYNGNFAASSTVPNYTDTIKLFSNNGGTGNAAMMKLYRFTITESGETVHDYVPALKGGMVGLYDQTTGDFLYDVRNSPKTFSYGGDILELEDDPYIENTGSGAINTRFLMAPDTIAEVDYALVGENASQSIVFGAKNTGVNFSADYYINGDGLMSFGIGDAFKPWATSCAPNLFRHRAVLDVEHIRAYYITRFVTNWAGNASASYGITGTNITKTAAHPLALFGQSSNATGLTFGNSCKAKIYGFKCWKAGNLVHDYAPCVKGGVPGFKDNVDGAFVTSENPAALQAGGKGLVVEADDGYISTIGNYTKAGSCYINTGYKASANTRVELDYALATNRPSGGGDWFLFEAAGGVRLDAYMNNNQMGWSGGGTNWRNYNTNPPQQTTQAGVRRTVIVDNKRNDGKAWSGIITAGFTNCNLSATPSTSATYNSKALCVASNADGGGRSSIKIYGLKIYESGTLQRSYKPYVKNGVPGLLDTIGGGFVSSAVTTNALKIVAGGSIDSDTASRDAYIESDGTQYLQFANFYQDYVTRVELDCQMLLPQHASAQYLFGNFGAVSGYLCFSMYVRGSSEASYPNAIAWNCQQNSSNWASISGSSATSARTTFILDAYGKKASVVSAAGTTNYSATISTTLSTYASKYPLTVCTAVDASGNPTTKTRLRVYGVKLYKNNALVHDYVPYKQEGVVGLYDVETGTFVTSTNSGANALAMSGKGVEGAEKWLKALPATETVSKGSASVTLTAAAAGAIRYEWTLNGDVLAETGESVTASWRRGDFATPDIYTCTAIYDVYGAEKRGAPVSCAVTRLADAFTIIVQ